MTTLLQQAFDEVSKLSPDQQDLIARRILDELEDERKWTVSFAESQDMLESMALEAIAEHKAGETRPTDEIL